MGLTKNQLQPNISHMNKNTRARRHRALKNYHGPSKEASTSFLVQTSRVKTSNGNYGTRTETIGIGFVKPLNPVKRKFNQPHQTKDSDVQS